MWEKDNDYEGAGEARYGIIVYQNIDKQGGEGGAAGEFD